MKKFLTAAHVRKRPVSQDSGQGFLPGTILVRRSEKEIRADGL